MTIGPAYPDALLWMQANTGLIVCNHGFTGIEARTEDGRVLGVVGYDKWTRNAVRIHCVMKTPIKEFLKAAFEYPFLQADKEVLIGEIAASNFKSRMLAHKTGFREVARIGDGWSKGDDLIIMQLRREWWAAGRKA